MIVTFYSYKGGTGRTLALANIAALLSRRGKKVLVVDFDLEAPGLWRYFSRFHERLEDRKGLIDLLVDASSASDALAVDWRNYVTEVPLQPTSLWLMTSGQLDERYPSRVLDFDWKEFFRNSKGGEFIENLRSQWRDKYDFTLIDSRTGITDAGGICTIMLPDLIVPVFVSNLQSLEGVVDVIARAQARRKDLAYDRPPAAILPILSRFDSRTEFESAQEWLDLSAVRLEQFYADWLPIGLKARQALEKTKLPYVAYFSFGETLPVLTQGVSDPDSLGYALNTVSQLIEKRLGNAEVVIGNSSFATAQFADAGFRSEEIPGSNAAQYLGLLLDLDGMPCGTCFQVAPGVLVTAWHVLDGIGAAVEEARVLLEPLAGGDQFGAVVTRVDAVRDLAVLISDTALPAITGRLTASDQMPLRTAVTVTGYSAMENPDKALRFLSVSGHWAGGTTWNDTVPLGRVVSTALAAGMSGAPVIRDSDGLIAGVVSGRYNSADGWLAGTVWVARTEDLARLLNGIADVSMQQMREIKHVDLLLTVTSERVRLTGSGTDVSAQHGGMRAALAEAIQERRRARTRIRLSLGAQSEAGSRAGDLSLGRVSRLIGESFLPGPIGDQLGGVLARAERAHQSVRLGLAVPPELAGLPWEALPGPNGRGPLALHPLVSFYRKADAAAGRVLPGPLRIVVAIAAPEKGDGALLDYERELRNVLAAVRSARQDAAEVRVVPFATLAAIREELVRSQVHVLHISGHGSAGTLDLEDDDGSARPVTADEFVDQAIPPGRMPLVITLSACYTAGAAGEDGTFFADRLCQRGAAAAIVTETSITDTYATRLLARVYGTLAQASGPDVVSALADARRQVQAELETSPNRQDNELADLGEWAAATVLAATGSVPVLDPDPTAATARQPSRPRIAGLAAREDWYFVGRRSEQRRWPADLTGSSLAGIVIYGIGGTGKTTLAAEIATRVLDREPGRILVSLTGPLTLESLLGAVTATIRRALLISGHDPAAAMRALDVAARADLGWQDRLAILRGHVLDQVPVLLLLDNFEDNVCPDGNLGYAVRDEVLAGLLAAWVSDPGRARLLVTCRYRFTLPGGAERALSFRQLGALSRAETMKLAWSLPALDKLDEGQLEQVWRLAGGHPRSLEYLDALLSHGQARYPDVTARLSAAISRRLSGADRGQWLSARTGLAAALAETVALAADDVLFDDLLARVTQVPGAADLLLGLSVYREPIDKNAVLFQAGQPDPDTESLPDRASAHQNITEILAASGITIDESFDLARVPSSVRAQLAPHIAELNRRPVPPFRPMPGLQEQIAACQAASLLTVSDDGEEPQFFVHRWTATDLAERAARENDLQLQAAERGAAAYWLWRVRVWPQDSAADLHDLLEARHHLLRAGDTEDAGRVTEWTCNQLHTWGAWDQESSLIHDTLAWLPADSPRRTAWIGQLGILAQARGDYDEAADQYQRSLDISERMGNQGGMASSYHQLGMLAQDRGDYDEATRLYQRSLDISERMGNQGGMASSYHQLGMLAQDRGDYDEATRLYQRSLDTKERIGNQAGMASSYHQLGMLAQDRGDYDEATRLYQRSLDISERLGDQAGMASSYHQLGMLAQDRGDYDEATRLYQRSLDILDRLGDQGGMASSYHQLGMLAQDRGDYDEATRLYQRSLDISERLGDQAGMASSYHQLGMLAQTRGDYDEATRLYQRSLQIFERLGDQTNMAVTYRNLGILEAARGGEIDTAVAWHVKALQIGLKLNAPETIGDLRSLAGYRASLSAERFSALLTEVAGDVGFAQAITPLLDRVGEASTPN